MRVCVYGAASAQLAPAYLEHARQLGAAMAQQGIGLIYGGGATGVMGAVAEGAAAENGEIIGISPAYFNTDGRLYTHCTQMLYTDTMRQRKQLMEDMADGFIMAPGGMGTFDEFFEILTLKQVGQHNKPIAILNTENYFDGLLAFMEEGIQKKFMTEACKELFFVSKDVDAVLQYISKAPREAAKDITNYKAVEERKTI